MNDNLIPAPLRVLVVDDSTIFRKVVRDVLADVPNLEVIGVAANGKIALAKIGQLRPDLITLDLEMPELDGLGVLRELQTLDSPPAVILLSAHTKRGAQATTTALELGAFDFVLKPSCSDAERSLQQLRADLIPKIEALCSRRNLNQAANANSPAPPIPDAPLTSYVPDQSSDRHTVPPKVVSIGVSTGGPVALGHLIPRLPADFPVPILIVQHMPAVFTRSLADELDRNSVLAVREAVDGDRIEAGTVLIAPGGQQMKVLPRALSPVVSVTDDPPERNCKPSVDYLFRSVANVYGPACLGVVLTGMGDDGLLGCKLLKRKGATIIAQDEASSVVYGMPRQIVENNLADLVAPLRRLPQTIMHFARAETPA